MSVESVIELGAGRAQLSPAPINPEWVIEGNPTARSKLLSVSADGAASSYIWDCTAGKFNWIYGADETIYIIQGGVIIRGTDGRAQRLSAGDSIFFPAGSSAEWHVEDYIRKFALIRKPLPKTVIFARKGSRVIRQILGQTPSVDASSAVFQNGKLAG